MSKFDQWSVLSDVSDMCRHGNKNIRSRTLLVSDGHCAILCGVKATVTLYGNLIRGVWNGRSWNTIRFPCRICSPRINGPVSISKSIIKPEFSGYHIHACWWNKIRCCKNFRLASRVHMYWPLPNHRPCTSLLRIETETIYFKKDVLPCTYSFSHKICNSAYTIVYGWVFYQYGFEYFYNLHDAFFLKLGIPSHLLIYMTLIFVSRSISNFNKYLYCHRLILCHGKANIKIWPWHLSSI